jgi:hypothetical protein
VRKESVRGGHLEELVVDERITLKSFFEKWDQSGPEYEQVACFCECGNEPLDSIKCGEILD